MTNSRNRLKGIFLPICTPFKKDESLDEEAFVFNMKQYAASKAAGFLVLGSNGENKSLTLQEQIRIARLAYANKAPHQIVMLAGLFEAEKLVLDFIEEVGTETFDYLTLQGPSYFRKVITDDILYGYFSRIADDSAVPVLVYNAPGFTGTNLSTELVEKLSNHQNIHGIKDSGKGDIERFFPLISDNFVVLAGSMNFLLKNLKGGGQGGIVSLGNAFPNQACQVYELFGQGKIDQAEAMNQKMLDANKVVSGAHGVAGVKKAMDLAGLKGTAPRRPLLPLTDEQTETMRKALTEEGLLQ